MKLLENIMGKYILSLKSFRNINNYTKKLILQEIENWKNTLIIKLQHNMNCI